MPKVMLLNDDYSPMEFVVHVLQHIFRKSRDEAVAVMLETHRHGRGVCGIYPREEAESTVAQVASLAKQNGHPLMCTIEHE